MMEQRELVEQIVGLIEALSQRKRKQRWSLLGK